MKCFSLVLLLAIFGCAAGPNGDAPHARESTDATSRASLIAALRDAGLAVRDAGTIEQPFFTVPAHVYEVEERDLQIYEFANAVAAEEAATRIAPNGGSIGATAIAWMAPPHFFRRDRLIINYIGSSTRVLAELERLVGPQFAGQT